MFKETTISSKTVFSGKVINLRVDEVETINKNIATREIVEHNGGVGIVAFDGDKILLVKQYRRPFDEAVLEIPAGKLEKGEEPLACAFRELEEETGYKTTDLDLMTVIYPTPGFCTEKLHIYFTNKLIKSKTNFDEDEYLELYRYTLDEAVNMIKNGEIKDAKTIVGILMAKELIKNS